MTTSVIFRKWRKSEDIIALFPRIPTSTTDPGMCASYEHVGQHGSADIDYLFTQTTKASPTEYAELLNELVGLGYDDLEINTVSKPSDREARTRSIADMPGASIARTTIRNHKKTKRVIKHSGPSGLGRLK